MEISLIIKTIVLIINAVGIWLALLVNSHRPKSGITFLFILMVLLMFIWVNFAYLSRVVTTDYGLLFIRLAWAITPLFFVTIFLFIKKFFKKRKGYLLYEKIIFIIGVMNIPIVFLTPLIIKNIWFDQNNILKITYGEGVWIFFGEVFLFTILSFYALLKGYIKSLSIEERVKIRYLLVGFFFFFLMNSIFNIIYPVFFKIFHLYQLGDYSTIIFLSVTAYSIVKHELFGIKVILTSIFVALIAILLALDIFVFTPELLIQLFKSLLLVIFLYFGYLLIKSVLQEIERREELEKLSRQLKKANAHLEKLLELRKELMHIVSHQLRAPLTVIRGMISMWCAGDFKNLSKKEKDDIKRKIYLSTEQLNNIVNDLLETMKFEEGYFKFKFKPVSIEELITEAINILKPNYEKKGLYIKFKRLSKTFPKIQADREYLKQVFLNIIDNAEKYTFKGGAVITISQKDRNLLVEISDSGIGISLEDQKKIFKKFSRSQKSKKINVTGSGLGLYIAKQIIEAHSGKIEVKSKGENKGAAFIITLPIIQAKK